MNRDRTVPEMMEALQEAYPVDPFIQSLPTLEQVELKVQKIKDMYNDRTPRAIHMKPDTWKSMCVQENKVIKYISDLPIVIDKQNHNAKWIVVC